MVLHHPLEDPEISLPVDPTRRFDTIRDGVLVVGVATKHSPRDLIPVQRVKCLYCSQTFTAETTVKAEYNLNKHYGFSEPCAKKRVENLRMVRP